MNRIVVAGVSGQSPSSSPTASPPISTPPPPHRHLMIRQSPPSARSLSATYIPSSGHSSTGIPILLTSGFSSTRHFSLPDLQSLKFRRSQQKKWQVGNKVVFLLWSFQVSCWCYLIGKTVDGVVHLEYLTVSPSEMPV